MVGDRVALTIAGSDSSGGAGVQIDLKTFNRVGVFGASVITSLTAQNTLGVQDIYGIPAEFVEKQLESVFSDLNVGFAKTGMLVNSSIVEVVASYIRVVLREGKLRGLVVDPVIMSKGGSCLLEDEGIGVMVDKLIPLATVVTPNIPEAEFLTGLKISTVEDMKMSARRIYKMGARYVVVKGGHLEGEKAIDVVFDGISFYELRSSKFAVGDVHGTGCCFSAGIVGFLTKNEEIISAIKKAKEFVSLAIKSSIRVGGGFRVLRTF